LFFGCCLIGLLGFGWGVQVVSGFEASFVGGWGCGGVVIIPARGGEAKSMGLLLYMKNY